MRKTLSLLLALLGFFDSLYLCYEYTSPSAQIVCFVAGHGCDAVRASAFAHIWGLPMPVFGVAGYGLIALFIIAESLVTERLVIVVRYALAGVTGFGFLFSLYLEYLQKFVIHAYCTWCVTSGVVMTALCSLSIYDVAQSSPEAGVAAKRAQLQNYFIVSLAALVVGIPAFRYLVTHGEKPPPPPRVVGGSNSNRLVRPDSHVTCNPDAAVTVVEFGDFECPICGSEERVMREVRAKYANQIRFVFRQFPLAHIHSFSTRMAEASECAAEQGKFWEMVDVLYSHQTDLTEQALVRDAADAGLDQSWLNQCLASGTEVARVKRDHEDGTALGVNGTPTIFINGKPTPGPNVPDLADLTRLIDAELVAKGSAPSSNSAPPTGMASSAPPPAPPDKHPSKTASTSSHASSPAPVTGAETGTPLFGTLGAAPGEAFASFQGGQVCTEAEAAMKQPTLINTSELRDIMAGNNKPLFVDVRSAKEYAAGKIPGAVNIPSDHMPQQWSTLPKDRMIIFYESGKAGDICAAARAAGRTLLEHGYAFDQVKVYQDGLAGWEKSGLQAKS